jgi:predicted RNA-binding Zn ribbon-like protein
MSSAVDHLERAALPAQRGDRPLAARCLDFTNTADAHDRPPATDKLQPGYVNLLAWCEGAGIVDVEMAQRLRRRAKNEPRVAAEVRKRAVALRTALFRIATSLSAEDTPDAHDLATLEREVYAARAHQRLQARDGALAWAFPDEPLLERVLWPIVVSAEQLLRSPSAGRIRRCSGEGCQRLFLDTTKNGSRRYCSAQGCGNRERVRRFRQRTAS